MPGDFLDTNILIYLLIGEAGKADRALKLLEARPTISVQVLNEIAMVAHRKINLPWLFLRDFLYRVRSEADVVPVTEMVHARGLAIAERHQLRIYDAMIVGAALEAGCETLWSEDMHDGLVIEGSLRIKNPFQTV